MDPLHGHRHIPDHGHLRARRPHPRQHPRRARSLTGRVPGGARGQAVPLQQHDAGDTLLGQVVGGLAWLGLWPDRLDCLSG